MLGDAEHPISFRFVPVERGQHVHVAVWAGNEAAGRGLAGSLVLRREEWVALREVLGQTRPDDGLGVALRDAIPVDMRHDPTLDYQARLLVAGMRVVHVDVEPVVIEPERASAVCPHDPLCTFRTVAGEACAFCPARLGEQEAPEPEPEDGEDGLMVRLFPGPQIAAGEGDGQFKATPSPAAPPVEHRSIGKVYEPNGWGDCEVCGLAWPCPSAPLGEGNTDE